MKWRSVIDQLPYNEPFLFVDELLQMDQHGAEGAYTFPENSYFYRGHFKDRPVTPGVILTECCAQIGLVCLGIYLLGEELKDAKNREIEMGLSSSEMEFLLPVFPGQKVVVKSVKRYFRFNKLKCDVKMYNTDSQLVCQGVIAGMLKVNLDG